MIRHEKSTFADEAGPCRPFCEYSTKEMQKESGGELWHLLVERRTKNSRLRFRIKTNAERRRLSHD
ncbi:hypothetical protein CW755_12550 [Geobacillus thermodenitrificans]|nr:hypothetical protein CW755_12550 [Geobacillus thermodenitrificans]